MGDGLSAQLQESLLAVLLFDDQHCKVVRAAVDLSDWDQAYELLARRVYEFIDRYSKAPKDNSPGLFDDQPDLRAGQIRLQMGQLKRLWTGIHVEYVLNRLDQFVRRQAIKSAVMDCHQLLQSESSEDLEELEKRFNEALKRRAQTFNAGFRLSDKSRILLSTTESTEVFPTGMKILDRMRLGPARKQLHLMIGAAKGGKTWWLVQLGKEAAKRHMRVSHVTLEMSEDLVAKRYLQSMFSVVRDKTDQIFRPRVKIEHAEGSSSLAKVWRDRVDPQALTDPKFSKNLSSLIDKSHNLLDRILVKEFPTGGLTIQGLEGYLDQLEADQRFVPDLLIVDFPDLMKIDIEEYRLALGNLFRRLRGLGVERDMAVAVVSQQTRMGAKSRSAREFDVAEDWSKIQTADVILVLQQTSEERARGLARVYVAAARSERDRFTLLVTQSYATGQFSLEDVFMPGNYFDVLERSDIEKSEV